MPRITVAPLSAEQIDTVFPLVREVAPGLRPAAWRRYARRVVGGMRAGRGGVMVARREGRRFPCGMFCYRREQDLAGEAVLVASHLVALDILDPRPVLVALVAELDALAPRLGCTAVHTLVADEAAEVAMVLAHAGHRRESQTLAKPTPGGPRPYRGPVVAA